MVPLLRSGWGISAAAQRGPGTGQSVPCALCRLQHTFYRAVETGCSVLCTRYSTLGTMSQILDMGDCSAASQTRHRVLGTGSGINGTQCSVPVTESHVLCMMELCTGQLAASAGMARQVQPPGTMETVAPGAVSWALHIGSGC